MHTIIAITAKKERFLIVVYNFEINFLQKFNSDPTVVNDNLVNKNELVVILSRQGTIITRQRSNLKSSRPDSKKHLSNGSFVVYRKRFRAIKGSFDHSSGTIEGIVAPG